MDWESIYNRVKANAKWWLENGHHYLQVYCVAEILMLCGLMYFFNMQMDFLYNNYQNMEEWAFLGFASFPTATWLMIKDVWDSINVEYPRKLKK